MLDEFTRWTGFGDLVHPLWVEGEDEVGEGHSEAEGEEDGQDLPGLHGCGAGEECSGDESEAGEAQDGGHDSEHERS